MENKQQGYEKLDPAVLPMFGFLSHFTELGFDQSDDPLALTVTEMKLTLPLDLDIKKNEDGSLTLGGSPPDMYAPVSLLPVYHRLQMTITITDEQDSE